MSYDALDLSKIRTYPIAERKNLVRLSEMVFPKDAKATFSSADFDEVVRAAARAARGKRQVIWMMGAHVIKCGLGPLIIDLVGRGIVSHVATNGAGSIHDFELALIGETSEDVPTAIEDGSFGMSEETGSLINRAVKSAAEEDLGYGEGVGRMIAGKGPVRGEFRHPELSVQRACYEHGVPFTVHATIGTDVIDQHPEADYGAIGKASGVDFLRFCASVSKLEEGVFLNFGSSVTGPEVFLKALSISRNLGHAVERFTTANFDLVELGDYRSPVGKDHPHYYYRPRKNIVNRPVSLGGRGFHIVGDHAETVPSLYRRVADLLTG